MESIGNFSHTLYLAFQLYYCYYCGMTAKFWALTSSSVALIYGML